MASKQSDRNEAILSVRSEKIMPPAIEMAAWEQKDVGTWLTAIGFEHHVENFVKAGISGKHLEMLTDEHLKE
jgi:IMP cyclohydrolase